MTTLVAALPMYDWPEMRAETDGDWAVLRRGLREKGIDAPETLARCNADLPPVAGGIRDRTGSVVAPDPATLPPDGFDLALLWRHPALLLAQTCWGPLELGLEPEVHVVGQGDYSDVDGGDGASYSSAILMRKRAGEAVGGASPSGPANAAEPSLRAAMPGLRGARLAFNGADSMSGFLALARDLAGQRESLDIFGERLETGSHRASIVAVAEDRADVCAVDCRTWDLAKRFEPRADALQVVGWTAKRPGLPFVTARSTPPGTVTALQAVLQAFNSRRSRR